MKVTKFLPQIKAENKVQGKKGKRAGRTAAASSGGTDRVELSTDSMDRRKMRELVEQAPDIRTEKVNALKDQIESGEYRPDSQEVANQMLASLLSENLTKS